MTFVERGGVRIHYETVGEDPEGGAAEVAALLPSGRALTLPGVGHIGVFLASERVLPHALRVLGEGFAQPCVRPAERGES